MIQVRLLTTEQKDLLIDKSFDGIQFFNPIQDINGNWVISEEEVEQCDVENLLWVKELPIIEYNFN